MCDLTAHHPVGGHHLTLVPFYTVLKLKAYCANSLIAFTCPATCKMKAGTVDCYSAKNYSVDQSELLEGQYKVSCADMNLQRCQQQVIAFVCPATCAAVAHSETESDECELLTKKRGCLQNNCSWNKKQALCFSKTMSTQAPSTRHTSTQSTETLPTTCEQHSKKRGCIGSGCSWNGKRDFCYTDAATTSSRITRTTMDAPSHTTPQASDVPVSGCEQQKKKRGCLEGGCIWIKNGGMCMPST